MSADPVHAAAVLAAGGSRRLGRAKQLLLVDGETLVRRAARLALATAPVRTLVITGHEAEAVQAAVSDLPVTCQHCADWALGMGASLRAAGRALRDHCAGLLIVLCDQPALDAAHLQTLVARWRQAPQGAVASSYGGVAGVPAVLPRSWFRALDTLAADQGARDLLRDPAARVALVPAPQLLQDIDCPGDLA